MLVAGGHEAVEILFVGGARVVLISVQCSWKHMVRATPRDASWSSCCSNP